MGDRRSKWMNWQQQREHLMCTNSKIIKIMLAEAGTLCGDDGVRCMHTQCSEYHNITMLAICWVEESKLIFFHISQTGHISTTASSRAECASYKLKFSYEKFNGLTELTSCRACLAGRSAPNHTSKCMRHCSFCAM